MAPIQEWFSETEEKQTAGVKLTTEIHSGVALKRLARRLQQAKLVSVPVSQSTNGAFFRVDGLDEAKEILYLSPTGVTLGYAWRYGEIYTWKSSDGRSNISFPFAFVDPRKPAITFPEAPLAPSLPIPDEVRLTESDDELLRNADPSFTKVQLLPVARSGSLLSSEARSLT